MGDVVELDPDAIAPARLQGRDSLVAVAVSQVEQAVADQGRGAIGQDLRETNTDESVRPVGGQLRCFISVFSKSAKLGS